MNSSKKIIESNNNEEEEFMEAKLYINNVEKKIKNLQIENDKLNNLNNNLEKEKKELIDSLKTKEIIINQQKSLSDNLKKENEKINIQLTEKIQNLINFSSELEKKDKIILNLKTELSSFNKNNNRTKINQTNFNNSNLQIMQEERLTLEKKKKKNSYNNLNLKNSIEDLQIKIKYYEENLEKKDIYIQELENLLGNIKLEKYKKRNKSLNEIKYENQFDKYKKRINTSENNLKYIDLKDPFIINQKQSLKEYKFFLQKVDEHLSNKSIFSNQIKE